MLQNAGLLYDDILAEISKYTDASSAQVKALFEDAGVRTVNFDNQIYRAVGLVPVDIRQSPAMRQTLEAGYRKTLGNMRNLTLTTANMGQTTYYNACNQAYMKVISGAFSYQEAIKKAVQKTAQDGAFVLYPSGHRDRVDVAVRRSVLTGVGQTCREIGLMNAEENDCDLMELSAHFGARPTHAEWQGQIVSLSGRKGYLSLSDIGYGTGDGFGGWNCRHDWFPYFEGYSRRNYTDSYLKSLNEKNIEYNGEKYSQYEISQIQRKYEREIRSAKREKVAFDTAVKGTSDPELKAVMKSGSDYANQQIKEKQAQMRDFIQQTGNKRDYFREQNYGKISYPKNIKFNKIKNVVDNSQNNGIIKSKNTVIFNNANNIYQAKEYAKNVLGFSTAEYDNFNLNIANMINLEVNKIYNIFGDLHKAGHLEGIIHYKQKSDFVAAYGKKSKFIYMKDVSSAEALINMSNDAKRQFESGFWSDGETEHVIRHELGHAVQHWLTDDNPQKLRKISNIRLEIMKECGIGTWSMEDAKVNSKKAGNFISYYALYSDGEFIAESIAEYMNNQPREIAKRVVDILLGKD